MKKRIITITMDVDEETHSAELGCEITENGELKTTFENAEMASILSAISRTHDNLATEFILHLHRVDNYLK